MFPSNFPVLPPLLPRPNEPLSSVRQSIAPTSLPSSRARRSKDPSFPNFEFLNSNHPRDTPRFLHSSFFKISAGQDPVEIDYRRTGESVDFAPLEDPFLVYLHGEKEKDV